MTEMPLTEHMPRGTVKAMLVRGFAVQNLARSSSGGLGALLEVTEGLRDGREERERRAAVGPSEACTDLQISSWLLPVVIPPGRPWHKCPAKVHCHFPRFCI